ncbi:MAG: hypothetical protein WDN66_01110 [Candidatus Saccharibacteria bacterium]
MISLMPHGRKSAHSEAFKTPDQIASEDSNAAGSPLLNTSPEQESSINPSKPKKDRKIKLWPPNKLGWIIIAVIVILIAAFCIWFFTRSTKPTSKPITAVRLSPQSH